MMEVLQTRSGNSLCITSTFVIRAGFVCLELYKVVQGVAMERYRNTFANLALPLFAMSEPMPSRVSFLSLFSLCNSLSFSGTRIAISTHLVGQPARLSGQAVWMYFRVAP